MMKTQPYPNATTYGEKLTNVQKEIYNELNAAKRALELMTLSEDAAERDAKELDLRRAISRIELGTRRQGSLIRSLKMSEESK